MISSKDIIKLYFILNKLMYKHATEANIVYNKQRNPDVDNPDFKQIVELSLAIDLLLETHDNIILDGEEYPYYGDLDSAEFNRLTDYLTYKYDLDPVPYIEFPKNTTKFILNQNLNINGSGTSLPEGGGPGFYLTKNASGQLTWGSITFDSNLVKTATQWNTDNTILTLGQLGLEVVYVNNRITQAYLKVGDGLSTWNTLPYVQDPTVSLVGRTNNYNDLDNLPVIENFSGNHSDLNLDDGTNPHGTTKSDVGLGNVDNTTDINKPISFPQQEALNLKANEDDLSDVAFSGDYNDLLNIPTGTTPITEHSALTLDDGTNPHGTTKSDVGLSEVDNTSDIDKPISTLQQQALNLKLNIDQVINDFTNNPNNPELAAGANTVYQILQDIQALEEDTNELKDIIFIGADTYTIQESDLNNYLIFNGLNGCTVTLPNSLAEGFTFWAETKTSEDVQFVAEAGGVLESKFGGTVSVAFEHLKFAKVGAQTWSGGLLTSEGIVGDIFTTEDIVANIDVPGLGIKKGDTLPLGSNITDAFKQLLITTYFPTFVAPTFSINASGSSFRLIGSSTDTTLTFTFNRGQILGDLVGGDWDENAVQDFRAGAANSYTINGTTQAGNTLLVSPITVAQGLNTYSGFVDYAAGPQPLDSDGNNFDSLLPADISPLRSDSFEGVYAIFASTSSITVATQQTLVSMLNANNLTYTLVAESGTDKQFFDIPNDWLSNRSLQSVQFFNTVSNQFDTTNQISTFDTSAITKTVAGNTVNYTRYTNNTANRGEIQIRLIF